MSAEDQVFEVEDIVEVPEVPFDRERPTKWQRLAREIKDSIRENYLKWGAYIFMIILLLGTFVLIYEVLKEIYVQRRLGNKMKFLKNVNETDVDF